ncbi:MAG: GFA family protein [Alphaproteobacteria bacterium]|jgi:hypothetical protein|nr:GFA family protein [Alphaproteobacteria bacterium]
MANYAGGCLCGAVRFEVNGPLTDLHACHCSQCRRQSGHFPVAASARLSEFVLTETRGLKWYRSSETARRGFCAECGSFLFWDGGNDEMNINVGSLDPPTGLKLAGHIFVDDKADYYEITDDLPKFAGFDKPITG